MAEAVADIVAKAAGEEAAKPAPPPEQPKSDADVVRDMSARKYLETRVVPVLAQAMRQAVSQRPIDPLTVMGKYIVRNDPFKIPEAKDPTCELPANLFRDPLPWPPGDEHPKPVSPEMLHDTAATPTATPSA